MRVTSAGGVLPPGAGMTGGATASSVTAANAGVSSGGFGAGTGSFSASGMGGWSPSSTPLPTSDPAVSTGTHAADGADAALMRERLPGGGAHAHWRRGPVRRHRSALFWALLCGSVEDKPPVGGRDVLGAVGEPGAPLAAGAAVSVPAWGVLVVEGDRA